LPHKALVNTLTLTRSPKLIDVANNKSELRLEIVRKLAVLVKAGMPETDRGRNGGQGFKVG